MIYYRPLCFAAVAMLIACFASCASQTASNNISHEHIDVEAPFEMPTISIPNFKDAPKYLITDFGAE